MIKHIVILKVIRKHEKYEKHNIKIKYENKRNNRNGNYRKSIIISVKRLIGNIIFGNVIWSFDNISKGNYEVIINVRIDKQNIDIRGSDWYYCKYKNDRESNIKYKKLKIKKEMKVIKNIKERD